MAATNKSKRGRREKEEALKVRKKSCSHTKRQRRHYSSSSTSDSYCYSSSNSDSNCYSSSNSDNSDSYCYSSSNSDIYCYSSSNSDSYCYSSSTSDIYCYSSSNSDDHRSDDSSSSDSEHEHEVSNHSRRHKQIAVRPANKSPHHRKKKNSSSTSTGKNSSSFKVVGSRASGFEGQSKKRVRISITTTETGGNKSSLSSKTRNVRPKKVAENKDFEGNKSSLSSKTRNIRPKKVGGNKSSLSSKTRNIRPKKVAAENKDLGGNKSSLSSKTRNIRPKKVAAKNKDLGGNKSSLSSKTRHIKPKNVAAENKDSARLLTVIVFDIETTGFSRDKERIIEIALQDHLGGKNSSFQTLVNPERYVPNSHIHGITTHMVNTPDVPRMKEVIPNLLQYVKSRQKPKGKVMLIAHNAHGFDVPFLIHEFSRCSYEIPPDWLFLDTLPLAREVMKSTEPKVPSKTSLQALREHYGIPLVGSAHRAMSDVKSLSSILPRLASDLELPVSGLVERSFRASDLIKLEKKKS